MSSPVTIREWPKADNYPHGAIIAHVTDKATAKSIRQWNGVAGVATYEERGREVAWDIIFPKKADWKYNSRLKQRLKNT